MVRSLKWNKYFNSLIHWSDNVSWGEINGGVYQPLSHTVKFQLCISTQSHHRQIHTECIYVCLSSIEQNKTAFMRTSNAWSCDLMQLSQCSPLNNQIATFIGGMMQTTKYIYLLVHKVSLRIRLPGMNPLVKMVFELRTPQYCILYVDRF